MLKRTVSMILAECVLFNITLYFFYTNVILRKCALQKYGKIVKSGDMSNEVKWIYLIVELVSKVIDKHKHY